eukprot:4636023-Amphidinium_carterae.1
MYNSWYIRDQPTLLASAQECPFRRCSWAPWTISVSGICGPAGFEGHEQKGRGNNDVCQS